MDYKKAYKDALERAKGIYKDTWNSYILNIFPELAESEDERIRKELLESFKYQQRESRTDKEWLNGIKLSEVVAWLEKQGEQKPAKNIVEIWKDMRLEVYAQASGNRHEPNYSDDTTKIFSLNDIDEIIEKISEHAVAIDNNEIIPCWSLAALLNIIPYPTLTQEEIKQWVACSYPPNHLGYSSKFYNNPIDACVEIIIKLHEQKLL